jgi:hypothetical protein
MSGAVALRAAVIVGLSAMTFGAMAIIGSGAALATVPTPVTLFVDGANGTNTTGCTSSGAGACQTIQEGINAAEALTNSAVTLDVAGQGGSFGQQTYFGTNTIGAPTTGLPAGDTLTVQGVGNPIVSGGSPDFIINGVTDITGSPQVTIDGVSIEHGSGSTGAGVTVNGDIVVLSDDTLTNNNSFGQGGALYNQSFNTVTLTNDTITNNTSASTGAAILTLDGSTVLNDDTLYNNTATGGSGIDFGATGTASISNSIVDATTCNVNEPSFGTIDGGHNVESDNSCHFTSTNGDVVNSSSINLATPLAANGSTGPQTYAISSNSSAYEIVPPGSCTVTSDERGLGRPGVPSQNCDAGAFEFQGQPPSPPTVGDTSSSNVGSTTATVSATITPGGADTHATATCSGGPYVASTIDVGAAGTPTASVNLTGLTPQTQYTCSVTATSSAVSSPVNSTAAATFTTTSTPPQAPPTVGSTSSSAVGSTSATLSAPVNPNGGDTLVSATCTGGQFVASSIDVGSGSSSVSGSVNLTGLSGNTAYSCAITATNSGGSNTSTTRAAFTTAPAPPQAPEGSQSSASGSSSSATGTASATIPGLSVTATGVGAYTIAQYSSAPVGAPHSFQGSGVYYDIHIAPGSTFTSMTIVFSNLGSTTSIKWWNGSSWVTVSPQTYSAKKGTITITLSSTSTPTLAQLTGTVFTGKLSLKAALARCNRFHSKKRRASCIKQTKKRFRHH